MLGNRHDEIEIKNETTNNQNDKNNKLYDRKKVL